MLQRVMRIPALESILLVKWDVHHRDNSAEINAAANALEFCQNKNYSDLSEAERKIVNDTIDCVRCAQIERYLGALKSVGLDYDAIDAQGVEIDAFDPEAPGEYFTLQAYAGSVSFLVNVLGQSLEGRTIMEIGTGKDGLSVLAYLSSRGARTIALDCEKQNRESLIRRYAIRTIWGRWENMGNHVESESVDAVYLKFMHNIPEFDGPLFNPEAYPLGTPYFEERYRVLRQEGKRLFEQHIAASLHRALKPNGLFVITNNNSQIIEKAEYSINNYDVFE